MVVLPFVAIRWLFVFMGSETDGEDGVLGCDRSKIKIQVQDGGWCLFFGWRRCCLLLLFLVWWCVVLVVAVVAVVGCWVLVVGCWLLVVGCWLSLVFSCARCLEC